MPVRGIAWSFLNNNMPQLKKTCLSVGLEEVGYLFGPLFLIGVPFIGAFYFFIFF